MSYLPGLPDDGETAPVVVSFQPKRKPYTITAKWWMRPVCWITRRPVKRTVWR